MWANLQVAAKAWVYDIGCVAGGVFKVVPDGVHHHIRVPQQVTAVASWGQGIGIEARDSVVTNAKDLY